MLKDMYGYLWFGVLARLPVALLACIISPKPELETKPCHWGFRVLGFRIPVTPMTCKFVVVTHYSVYPKKL